MPPSLVSTPVDHTSALLGRLIEQERRLRARLTRITPHSEQWSRLCTREHRSVLQAHRELHHYTRSLALEEILALPALDVPRKLECTLLAYWQVCVALRRLGVDLPVRESREVSAVLEAWRWLRPTPGAAARWEGLCP